MDYFIHICPECKKQIGHEYMGKKCPYCKNWLYDYLCKTKCVISEEKVLNFCPKCNQMANHEKSGKCLKCKSKFASQKSSEVEA